MKKEITTIWVTPNFCDCRLCRGSVLPQTDDDRALRNFQRYPLGLRVYKTGGRNPDMVTYDPDVVSRVEWSAKGNVQDAENYDQRSWTWTEVLRLRDSVHGCDKLNLLQEVSFHIRPNWEGHLSVVYTRPWTDSFHKEHRHPLSTTMTLKEWMKETGRDWDAIGCNCMQCQYGDDPCKGNFQDLPPETMLRVTFSQNGIEGASPIFER